MLEVLIILTINFVIILLPNFLLHREALAQLDESAVPDDDDDDGPSVPLQLDESSMLSDLEAGDRRELQPAVRDRI